MVKTLKNYNLFFKTLKNFLKKIGCYLSMKLKLMYHTAN